MGRARRCVSSAWILVVQGKRYSMNNSRIMIHQPLGGAQGQAADIEIQANEILHHKLTLNGYIAEFSGQPMEKITADTDRDFFMSAQEAVEYGALHALTGADNDAAGNGRPPVPSPFTGWHSIRI